MNVILVNQDNTLTITQSERIMQRSKLVDTLWFLVAPEYNGYNMADFSVLLEYVLPVSRQYRSEILTLSEDMYNGRLKYLLPLDTELTSEAGRIEVQLTFAMADLDISGNPIQRVRKTDSTLVDIIPIKAWSDIIPDSALSSIDQRLIKADAQIKALADLSNDLNANKADNLRYDATSSELQLVAGNKAIGNKVIIVSCDDEHEDDVHEDCVPVVLF